MSVVAPGIWQFADLLPPVALEHRVTLGEGSTPLIDAPRLARAAGIHRLLLKLEGQNPTGSFKDRGTAAAVSVAASIGAAHLVEDSSGNAGASAAAYAARVGLQCTVYAPASAPTTKLRQAAAYGARVVTVSGTRDEVTAAALAAARDPRVYHLNHNASDTFAAGMRTLAGELAPALATAERPLPAIVMPAGGGSLIAGCYEGFGLLVQQERLASVPALFGVQSEACAPLVRAMDSGWDTPLAVMPGTTIAGGITIGNPPRGPALLRAMRETCGGAIAVTEEALVHWGRLLATLEGVFAEPTAAAAVAGMARLVAIGRIPASGTAIVVITGSGLKDSERSGA